MHTWGKRSEIAIVNYSELSFFGDNFASVDRLVKNDVSIFRFYNHSMFILIFIKRVQYVYVKCFRGYSLQDTSPLIIIILFLWGSGIFCLMVSYWVGVIP